jgi:hypothetical protein
MNNLIQHSFEIILLNYGCAFYVLGVVIYVLPSRI